MQPHSLLQPTSKHIKVVYILSIHSRERNTRGIDKKKHNNMVSCPKKKCEQEKKGTKNSYYLDDFEIRTEIQIVGHKKF